MGFADADKCPRLCKLAYDYLKRSEGCENNIYDFFAHLPELQSSLYVKLMGNLKNASSLISHFIGAEHLCLSVRFIINFQNQIIKRKGTEPFIFCLLFLLSYALYSNFLYGWQVMDVESVRKPKFKGLITMTCNIILLGLIFFYFSIHPLPLGLIFSFMKGQRKQSFERATEDLKATRAFSTLVEELKAIGQGNHLVRRTWCRGHSVREVRCCYLWVVVWGLARALSAKTFSKRAKAKAVVVEGREAEAFKESDVIYQSSTDAASSLLYRYRMGPGYQVAEHRTVDQNYWEKVGLQEEDQRLNNKKGEVTGRKPYRIELVGVVCDPYLAVVRGIRRAITTRGAVRVHSRLKSHKRFASAFERYCQLVDKARLYCTNSVGAPPRQIAWKDGDNMLLLDPEGYKCLTNASNLRAEAESIYELYTDPSPIFEPGSFWKDIVMDPSRPAVQIGAHNHYSIHRNSHLKSSNSILK
ncbi:hypothetical protein NC652_021720 [Populus alba x Populus x berolinensis]|nr:hypothetical protein NC652_021720 [Populus alba x Populus x berolinensis]